ncbi:biogenesis of lysosome-related organelles complex 1 subunit 5 isoform X2 [Corvus moneduloides]|uniref:biogenesis of lysosome-related organelles complex 1 subunit 5 isoform X2 n=1 Tax=Corvus moneduloides TaxID=1196302 RepID=UPI0013622452|nr:biogenesis of lysosome-related organelles complex 1 subunit 5 isoform X2 [Corvus moneduloides]
MSGAGPASPGRGSAAAPPPADRRRDSPVSGSPIQPIIKDIGEVYSRLLDHRPVIQGEIRYFVKEFEEKRGLRELRVLENLKTTIFETNERVLPKCEQAMQDNLSETFKRLQAANAMIHRLQEREYEVRKWKSSYRYSGFIACLKSLYSKTFWLETFQMGVITASGREGDGS